MNYHEALTECLKNLVELNKIGADLKEIDEACDKADKLMKDGPENFGSEECPRCEKQGQVSERHSFGIYAGIMCDDCAYISYKDHCGLEGRQGDPQELDEPIEPEPYYGSRGEW